MSANNSASFNSSPIRLPLTDEQRAEFERAAAARDTVVLDQLTADLAASTSSVFSTQPGMGTTGALKRAAEQLGRPIAFVQCALIGDPFELDAQMRNAVRELGGPDVTDAILVFDELSRTTPTARALLADVVTQPARYGLSTSLHRVWIKDITAEG